MSLPSKAVKKESGGRVRISVAGSAVAHAKLTVGAIEVELTAGLANRRKLYIKPVAAGSSGGPVYVFIGPSGFALADGTPVWEKYELVLDAGPEVQIFAKRGDFTNPSIVDVRVLEVGED